MGRRVKERRLAVWMNGELVGWWSLLQQGVHEFRYAESWIASPYKRPISLSMPLQPASEAYRGVQLLPPDTFPSSVKTINGEPLTKAGLAEELRIIRMPHLSRRGDDEF